MNLRPNWPQMHRRLSRVARGGVTRRSLLRPASAQALVEFVLVSVPLLGTMFFIFEFGIAFFDLEQLNQVVQQASREVASCANQCEDAPPTSANAPDTGKIYKDMRALQAVVNKNPAELNGTKLIPENIEYILIRRVADNTVAAGNEVYKIYTDQGETDISRQYQLYVTDLVGGKPNPAKYLPFKDGTAAQAIALGLPDPTTYVSGKNATGGDVNSAVPYSPAFDNNNYRSSPCLGTAPSGAGGPGTGAGIMTDDANASGAASGFSFDCRYNYDNQSDPNLNWSRGRPVCQPSERFYVEIGYRHHWVTPFFPTAGNASLSRPANDNGYVILRQKAYSKVEPRYFPVSGGVCPTGVS